MSALLSWIRMLLALAVIVMVFGFIGNGDYADALVMEAMEKDMRPQRVRAYYRELLCDCLKTYRGRALRLQIVHQPDRKLCRAVCVYDGGAVTKGTL